MRILVATGSSGGHIFPAVALVDRLKSPKNRVMLVLPKKSKQNKILVNRSEVEFVEYIHNSNLTLEFSKKNIIEAYFFFISALQSLWIIINFKPDVVIGFGSLNTLALIFWAWLFRINTVIHEQNVICGRANRVLSRIADKVAISFPQTAESLKVPAKKIKLVGNPLRKDLVRIGRKEALDFFGFKEEKFNILVTGGSQGSHKLNATCFEALAGFKNKDRLQVIHIVGSQDDFVQLKEKYASSGLSCKIFDFFPQMQYAYSAADLVISRAGATTIAELIRFALPAVLVPYPFAYDHQLANARILESKKASVIINDEEFDCPRLSAIFSEIFEDNSRLRSMHQAYGNAIVPEASSLLAKEVLDFYAHI